MIEISKLTKTYDRGTKALKDVNITIDDGEFVFITGRSGSWKIYTDQDPLEGSGADLRSCCR